MEYIFSLMPSMVAGLGETLKIFIITLIVSLPLGVILGILRKSKFKIISRLVGVYIWIMRGTPLMLQIVFIFFGLPLVGISLDRFPAAITAFILNYGAYFGEIFRGGIDSIDRGQYEAAKVLGFTRSKTFVKIILPQALKVVIPSLANETITLIKDTSLVYVVGIGELLRAGKIASNTDASLVPLLVVALIYLGFTGVMTLVLNKIELRYSYYE